MNLHHHSDSPSITFVGRPLDLNKGLSAFLAAIEGLLGGQSPPEFQVWLVGGDDEELEAIRLWVASCPRLARFEATGNLHLWGMQERHRLSEIYARSGITVMPSRRETFGLVAVEAMMCGCPVVVAGTGGPADTVLAGRTGSHVDADDPAALQAAIAFYLRGPELRASQTARTRAWASFAFDIGQTYGQIAALYSASAMPLLREPIWNLPKAFGMSASAAAISAVTAALDRVPDVVELVRDRHHRLLRLQFDREVFALKIFEPSASHTSIIFPFGLSAPLRRPADFVANVRYHTNNVLVPRLIASDLDGGWALSEWVDGPAVANLDLEQVRELSHRFSKHGAGGLEADDYERWVAAAVDLAGARDVAGLHTFDAISMQLNQKAEGAALGKRSAHPFAELLRIELVAKQIGWEIPDDMATAIAAAACLAMKLPRSREEQPILQHNDLKPEHVLMADQGLVCLDTEHALFAFGSLDVGCWLAWRIWRGTNAAEALQRLAAASWSGYERTTAVQWLIAKLTGIYLSQVYGGGLGPATIRARRVWSDLLTELASLVTQLSENGGDHRHPPA